MAEEVGNGPTDRGRSDLFTFVWQRTQETLVRAEERGDELRTRFARRSLAILVEIRANLDEGGSIGDLMAVLFLRRLAQDYRDHPDYREEWRIEAR